MASVTITVEDDDFCKATGRWPVSAGIADIYEMAQVLDDCMAGTLLDKARRLVEGLNRRELLLMERVSIFGVWDRRDSDAPMHFVDASCEDDARHLAATILGAGADIVAERMTVAWLFSAIGHKRAGE